MPPIRHLLKVVTETALARTPVVAASALRVRGSTLVLAYHNIVPDGDASSGDRSLHLSRAQFAVQLDHLARRHDVVPLSDLLTPARARARPRIAITFDDAYRGAVTLGVEELAKRGLPATIFVAPAFVGDGAFWWDELTPPAASQLAPDVRHHALAMLQGADAAVRAWARSTGRPTFLAPSMSRVATEDELRAAVSHSGIVLASHTWSHPALPTLRGTDLEDEMRRPLEWLRARFSQVVPWISYPYGLSSAEVGAAAAAAGYQAGLLVEGGWLSREHTDPYQLPRLNIPAGLSTNGFRLRAAGLFCEPDR